MIEIQEIEYNTLVEHFKRTGQFNEYSGQLFAIELVRKKGDFIAYRNYPEPSITLREFIFGEGMNFLREVNQG